MRHILIIATCLNTFLTFGQELENNSYNEKFILSENKLYLNDSLYSGDFNEYYPGNTKIEGKYRNGLREGVFISYFENHSIQSKINYINGLKNGTALGYDWRNTLISKEAYVNDTLISGIYWNWTGQVEKKIYENKLTLYPIDSSIYRTIPFIKGLQFDNIKKRYQLNKVDLCNNLQHLINVALIRCEDCGTEETKILDTLISSDYIIKSYYIGGPIYENINGGNHWDWDAGLISNNKISDKTIKLICDNYPSFIWISDIIVIDKYKIETYLPNLKVYIEYK
jgi:hypothetical protein